MSRKAFDFFAEEYDPDALDIDDYKLQLARQTQKHTKRRIKDTANEVGKAPDVAPEILELREKYKHDFVALHRDVFPESTGIKEFGKVQQESIRFGQDVFHYGGRLLKLEPRGYAKTTRITNEALFAVLAGLQDYVVIVCSNLIKAQEIVDSIKTELMNNDTLLDLFPGPIACFRHIENAPMKARYQTYDGKPTYIQHNVGKLRFPAIPGEPSAGRFIEVRPLTNLKGLNHKVKSGPDAGKVFRPTLFIFDDPQTHAQAKSPAEVAAIVATIKRDALKGGSQSRRVAAIMAITPVCHGDVAFYFEKMEHSWEIVRYKMVEKFPDAHDKWMQDYAKIYMAYDRTIRGDRIRALMEARKYVEENYEELHAGGEVSWDWAFGWEEDPQTEISPLQHAYNIILDDGEEDFQFECQCNTEYGLYDLNETIHAPNEQILSKVNFLPRKKAPQATVKIVTHVDVNMDILTYVTIASADPFHPYIIDYGTHPQQPGIFSKRNMSLPLRKVYSETTDYREVLYLAVKDLVQTLSQRPYKREDGIDFHNHLIGVDVRYEEDYILRAIKDSNLNNLVLPVWGTYVGPDDELLHERTYPEGTSLYHNCVERPNRSRTFSQLMVDVNFFKTEVHKAWNQTAGLQGSLTMFQPEWIDQHKVIADHCNIERPEKLPGKKTDRTRIVWKEKHHQPDNEFFDNITNCFALLSRLGISILPSLTAPSQEETSMDMAEYMREQRGKKLL